MAYSRGDVVLVPFPFTDLSTNKVRPALVVSTSMYTQETGSLIVAMITSVPYSTAFDHELGDWQTPNLLYPSWVRTKLSTLDPSLVIRTIGQLTDVDMLEVEVRMKKALAL